jgi:glycerol-3-phosphate dehydrogenase (NAD(P)+)
MNSPIKNSALKIGICGLGNFGYAIAKHLDNKYKEDDSVQLAGFEYDNTVRETLQKKGVHPYIFTNVKLSKSFSFVSTYEELLKYCDVLIVAVSSQASFSVISAIKPLLEKKLIIINTAKALDSLSAKRLSEIYIDQLGDGIEYASLSGGTIASDLFKHEPLGVDIACKNESLLKLLIDIFSSDELYVQGTTDLVGVELAGAYKNVLSLIAGLVAGLGFSYGSETHIISVVAQKIGDFCVDTYGANPRTFSIGSQSWGNDMWMSATGNTRNREFGKLLGRGMNPKEAIADMESRRKTVEAIRTLQVVEKTGLSKEVPVISSLKEYIIDEKITLNDVRKTLLATR